jgi:hypothetical protein
VTDSGKPVTREDCYRITMMLMSGLADYLSFSARDHGKSPTAEWCRQMQGPTWAPIILEQIDKLLDGDEAP